LLKYNYKYFFPFWKHHRKHRSESQISVPRKLERIRWERWNL